MLNSDFKTIYESPTPKDLKVGQVWKCLEDQKVVMIKMVSDRQIWGYMFTGFEVCEFGSMCLPDFIKYFKCIYEPDRK